MKFQSEGTKTIALKLESFAEDARAAARQFFDEHGVWPESVWPVCAEDEEPTEIFTVATACEGCCQAIFEGEPYVSCEDADLCKRCADEMAQGGNDVDALTGCADDQQFSGVTREVVDAVLLPDTLDARVERQEPKSKPHKDWGDYP